MASHQRQLTRLIPDESQCDRRGTRWTRVALRIPNERSEHLRARSARCVAKPLGYRERQRLACVGRITKWSSAARGGGSPKGDRRSESAATTG